MMDGFVSTVSFWRIFIAVIIFFFRNGRVDKKALSSKKVFAYSIGKNKEANNNDKDKIPGLCLFKEKLSHVEEFKFKLLEVIKNSHEMNNINKQYPVIDSLSVINKNLGSGWLLKLNF